MSAQVVVDLERVPRAARLRRGLRRLGTRAPPADEDSKLVDLVRAQAPLRRTLAQLAGRFVAGRGGERRGFARLGDYAVERLFRDTRVDRIWEGTSEMMRSIILNGVMKRDLSELLS